MNTIMFIVFLLCWWLGIVISLAILSSRPKYSIDEWWFPSDIVNASMVWPIYLTYIAFALVIYRAPIALGHKVGRMLSRRNK